MVLLAVFATAASYVAKDLPKLGLLIQRVTSLMSLNKPLEIYC